MVNALLATSASAHVKWFCAFDVAGQPRGLENVLCPDFEILTGLSVLALMSGCLMEGTPVGLAMIRSIDRATQFLRDNTEMLFRAGAAFFFISIWAVGGILLTPELKTSSPAIGALHLAIAAGMLSRRTMPLSAAGIAIIFGIAVWEYGIFHLADYPVFLGVAAYLALTGLRRDLFGVRAIDVVRYSAGITLMWASIEKWAYPEWSFPLLAQHKGMTLGFDPEFFMRAAGAIEFALAFSLMWTPLVRRIGAIMLAGMFVSAVAEFGKVDLIGHTLIIVVLAAIVADNGGEAALVRRPWLAPLAYGASVGVFLLAYYVGHTALFGTAML
ncbi:MAG: hypothetical protein JO205_08650 [Pseudolabrys sp.]|nr:hypothetical protein [Pseudolabrys sp.]MBV9261429.1 hypothetical protein [Pseudolabrys sp.]